MIESLTELRRQAVALGLAKSAIGKCCLALGERATNDILAQLDSRLSEVQDKIEIREGILR